jgi:hypothetical protein
MALVSERGLRTGWEEKVGLVRALGEADLPLCGRDDGAAWSV